MYLRPEDCRHFFIASDPDNEMFGISNVETIVYDGFGEEQAELSNYAFFTNDATPSGIIVVDSENFDEAEVKREIEVLRKQLQGGANKHRQIFSNIIKDFKAIRASHKDMDFVEQRKYTTEKICSAMGTPKVILGYSEGVNYTNADIMYTKYIENTVQPFERWLESVLTELIHSAGLTNYKIKIPSIETREKTESIQNMILQIQNGIMSRNEAREELGMEPLDQLLNEMTVKKDTIRLEDVIVDDGEMVDEGDDEEVPPSPKKKKDEDKQKN